VGNATNLADVHAPCMAPLRLQHQAAGASGSHARGAWQAYAGDATAAPRAGWRPRSRHTALWVCAATLAGGFGIFYGAILSHDWLDGYTWLSPQQAEERLRHPTPQRQHLLGLMMQERQQQRHQQQQNQQQQGRQQGGQQPQRGAGEGG
jgi:hypothetical protein